VTALSSVLGLLQHAFDFLLPLSGNGDAVRFAGGLVGGGNVEDAVGAISQVTPI